MMSADASQSDSLWLALLEAIEDGLLVLSDEGEVIYANETAARLLDYERPDLLGLDQDDMLALCQPHRFDVERLKTVLVQDLLGPHPTEIYRVTTQRQRLLFFPFALDLPEGRYRCLLLQEDAHWRDELIADAVMREMRSPLTFSVAYSDALLNRLHSPNPYREELVEFARIIRSGVARALDQWEGLFALYEADPRRHTRVSGRPVALAEALEAALRELRNKSRFPLPTIEVALPDNLPPMCTRPNHLHDVLLNLLEETTSRLSQDGDLTVHAAHKDSVVQVDFTLGGSKAQMLVRAYLFDVMPLSTVEQIIILYGGRLWIDSEPGQPTTFSFTLPTWDGTDNGGDG